jgi:hypothetical protein
MFWALFACNGSTPDVPLAPVEVAEPGHWDHIDDLNFGHAGMTVTELPGQRWLIFGGYTPRAELLDLETQTLRPVADAPNARRNHAAVALPDGRVLVAGGVDPTDAPLATSALYDPATDTWSEGPPLDVARTGLVLFPLDDGQILAVGGVRPSSCARFDGTSWTPAGPAPVVDGAAALVLQGNPWLMGGLHDDPIPTTHWFDGTDWIVGPALSTPRAGSGAVVLSDGRALLVGGWDGSQVLASAEVWDGAGWSSAGSGTVPRVEPGVAQLADGRVLVFGGDGLWSSPDGLAHRDAEVVNPSDWGWQTGANGGQARRGPHVFSVDDGRVVALGGHSRRKLVTQVATYLPEPRPRPSAQEP